LAIGLTASNEANKAEMIRIGVRSGFVGKAGGY
jgi:hypothetical protein